MAQWQVFIAPLNRDGNYGEYQEVTKYVGENTIGNIKRRTSSNEFGTGIAVNDSISIKLNNSDGKFSEAGSINSIFTYRRDKALVKVTYLFGEYEPICGTAVAGVDVLGPAITAFEGFLNERNTKQDILDDTIAITVLGKETYWDGFEVDTSFVYPTSTVQEAIYDLLNVGDAYNLFDIQYSNIQPKINVALNTMHDDVLLEFLKDNTARESIDLLLEASNSVLYIENNVLYVSGREANAGDPVYTFYGQASNIGLESIQNLSGYTDGINRTYNFWKWKDTNLTAKSSSSITDYGTLKHDDLDFKAVNIEAAQQNTLDSYRDEYAVPKRELRLTSPVNVEVMAIKLFDKVLVDYPNVPISAGAGNVPTWGMPDMVWADEDNFNPATDNFFSWPKGQFNVEISINTEWKITAIDTSSKTDLVTFDLREV